MSFDHRTQPIVCLGILLLLPASSATADDASVLPRYRFEAGKTYVYEIRIESNLPDCTEVLSGHSRYTVKSVDSETGIAVLNNAPTLSTKREWTLSRPHHRHYPFDHLTGAGYEFYREITVDPSGNVLKNSGRSQLPQLLGNLWQLVLDPMPQEGKTSWRVKNQVLVTNKDTRFPWRPSFATGQEANRSARQTVSYKLDKTSGKTISIQKTYKLTTDEKVNDKPRLVHTGKGRIEFDRKRGLPRSVEMKYTLVLHRDKGEVETSTTVSARLLDAKEAEELTRKQQEAAEAARAAAAEAAKPKKLDDDALDAAIEDLKTGDHFKRQAAANLLAKAIPAESRREEIASSLEPLLKDPGHFVSRAAAKALGVWGTKKNVPALIAVLDGGNVFQKRDVITALAALSDPRGAEALARQVSFQQSRMSAAKGLKTMGPVAEEPVLDLLEHGDWTVRMSACQILAEVGTEKSLKRLEKLQSDSNGIVGMEAQRAVNAINARCDEEAPPKKSRKKKDGA